MEKEKSQKQEKKKITKTAIKGDRTVVERKGLPRTGKIKLPATKTWLKQPNAVTLMRYDFSTLQIRTLICVMEKLQDSIEESIAYKKAPEQLSLFEDVANDQIRLNIKIKDFGISADRYGELKESLIKIAHVPVVIDSVSKNTGDGGKLATTLFSAFIPKEYYGREVEIRIDKEIAKMLVDVTKGFTKFMKEIAFSSQNKYTIRLYMFISSWKDKGGCQITYAKLREWLKIEDKYKEYKDFNKRVIRPAYEELFEKADCWFEVKEVYNGKSKNPDKLQFKIINGYTSDYDHARLLNQQNHVIDMLESHFGFKKTHINFIRPYITSNTYMFFLEKMATMREYIHKNVHKIKDIPQYMLKSLIADLEEKYGMTGEPLEDFVDAEVID